MRFSFLVIPFLMLSAMPICEAKKTGSSPAGGERSRIMFFGQTAINRIKMGLAEAHASSCVIVISNSSSAGQLVFFRPNAEASGSYKGDASCALESTGASPLDPTGATINPGGAPVVIRCTYPSFPKKKTGQQVVVCGGEVEARDVSVSPGSVEVSGSLEVFIETNRKYQNLDKDGNVVEEGIGTFPVYSSIPVTVNGGRAF